MLRTQSLSNSRLFQVGIRIENMTGLNGENLDKCVIQNKSNLAGCGSILTSLDSIGYSLFDPSDFADRISGVTLDAFSAGSPIVALAETWIARMAQRFDAGVVVQDLSSAQICSAAQHAISGYGHYNQNARAAGKVLQEENSGEVLFKILAS